MSLSQKKRLALQRKKRGWDDSDTWSLDCTMAEWLLPRLRRFKEINGGYPMIKTPTQWDKELAEMIWTFEFIASDKYWNEDKATMRRVKKGLRLFSDNFCSLWW